MHHQHPHGKPKNILKFSDSKKVIIDNKELDKIFDHPEIQDCKVVILSLIGVFRGGKSFFLDYCLRFLYAHFPSIKNGKRKQSSFQIRKDWMGKATEPLKGFSWCLGSKRNTVGIIMWSDVFLHTCEKTGENIAIFVMDTQGLFDNESTPTDNSRIFSLGTLISSIQVLNVLNRIQEDQLQYLQFAAEFTKFTAQKSNETREKPFQNLTFIIRDWINPDDYEFGIAGGKTYIDEVLKPNPNQQSALKAVRESIFSCFEKIDCCLLPYPGKNVVSTKGYDGNWSEMDQEFSHQLFGTIEHILHPCNLLPKKANCSEIKVSEMKDLILSYLESFQSNEDINVLTIYELTVANQTNSLIKKCINHFKTVYLELKDFFYNADDTRKLCTEKTMEFFNKQNKMGTKDEIKIIRAKLEEEIEITFEYLKKDAPYYLTVLYSRMAYQKHLKKFFPKKSFNGTWWPFYYLNKNENNEKPSDEDESFVASETVSKVGLKGENVKKPLPQDIIKPMISKGILAVLLIIFLAFLIVIATIVEYIGMLGLLIIFAIIIIPIIFKIQNTNVEINDAINIGSKIVTEISENVTNAMKSLSGAANAGAVALSVVRRIKDIFS